MMKKSSTTLLLFLALAMTTAATSGEIYKWTDEDGNVQYGDRPAEGAIRLTSLESRPTNNERVRQSVEDRKERQMAADEADEELAAQEPSKAELRAAAEERAGQCQTYRARLQTAITSRRLYRQDEQGERVYLDDSQIDAAREEAQALVEEYCST